FEQRAADTITVANADLIVRQPLHREVLAELSKHEVVSLELPFPIAIGVDLIDEDGPMLTTVTLQISLAVAVDVQPPDFAAAADCVLPHGRVHALAFPLDVARQADVHREQLRHLDAHRGTFLMCGFSRGDAASAEKDCSYRRGGGHRS